MNEATSWPATGVERVEWPPRTPLDELSRRKQVQLKGLTHYEASVPATIANLTYRPPSSIAADLEEAAAEIARFDQEAGDAVSPYASLMLRSEAAASSRIENLTASARAIAAAEAGVNTTGNGPRIVANTRTMWEAMELEGPITSSTILTMHEILMADDPVHAAGVWRTEPVWIGTSSISPHGAVFVPPVASRVPDLIEDLVTFLHGVEVGVLAQAALAHAQFELIHPFTDGNGRVGRALIHAHLRSAGLVRRVPVPISAGLLASGDRYVSSLTAYRAGDPDPLLELFVDASLSAVTNGRALAADIDVIRASWLERVNARADSAVWRILDLLLRQPVVTTATLADELGLAPGHIRRHIDRLLEAEVVREQRMHRAKGLVWRSPEVLTALDEFAERAGRRAPLG